MAMGRYETEEVVSLLRRADVLHGHGMSTVDAIRRCCFPDYLAGVLPFMVRPGAKGSMRPIRAGTLPACELPARRGSGARSGPRGRPRSGGGPGRS